MNKKLISAVLLGALSFPSATNAMPEEEIGDRSVAKTFSWQHPIKIAQSIELAVADRIEGPYTVIDHERQ